MRKIWGKNLTVCAIIPSIPFQRSAGEEQELRVSDIDWFMQDYIHHFPAGMKAKR